MGIGLLLLLLVIFSHLPLYFTFVVFGSDGLFFSFFAEMVLILGVSKGHLFGGASCMEFSNWNSLFSFFFCSAVKLTTNICFLNLFMLGIQNDGILSHQRPSVSYLLKSNSDSLYYLDCLIVVVMAESQLCTGWFLDMLIQLMSALKLWKRTGQRLNNCDFGANTGICCHLCRGMV